MMSSCDSSTINAEKRPAGLQISFGGCAALCVYHAGVCKCLIDHAPNLLDEFEHLYGASAGAFAAVCCVCKCDPLMVYEWIMDLFKTSREYSIFGVVRPSFGLFSRMRDFIETILPQNAHKLCRNRVHISLSVLNGFGLPKNWLLTDFTTRKELINAIVASSMMPGYGDFDQLPVIRGKRCFDGGLTSNIPFVLDPNIISVTPFSGESSICPPMEPGPARHVVYCDQPFQVTSQNLSRLKAALYPTSAERLEELFHQGYKDSLRFFKQKGFIPESVSELKTFTTPPSGVSVFPDEGTPGDSGYFSRADSSSQSDYCDNMASDNKAETFLESGGLRMQSLEHYETDRQLTNSSRTTNSNKISQVSKLESKNTTRTTIQV